MKLINLLSNPTDIGPCVLGVGAFDGVHRGHQALIQELRDRATQLHLPAVIFTFDHSPRRLLSPATFPGEITTPQEKFNLLMKTGVDWVVFRPFEQQFAMTSPTDFVRNIVIAKFKSVSVFVGFNFGFGLHREGTAAFLEHELIGQNIECRIIPPVKIEKRIISSTKIREAIVDGDFQTASRFLGRYASFSGEVIHGDHRGREMGFPTANLNLSGTTKVLPPHGVYFCLVDTPTKTFYSLVNIGVRPTFNRKIPLLEAHLLDFNADIYHQTIRVRFIQKIREEIRFPSMDALISQINKDLANVRDLTKTAPKNVKPDLDFIST